MKDNTRILTVDENNQRAALFDDREHKIAEHGPRIFGVHRIITGYYVEPDAERRLVGTLDGLSGHQQVQCRAPTGGCRGRCVAWVAMATWFLGSRCTTAQPPGGLRSDHDGARERYEEALPLYRRVGSVLGETNCIQSLGDIGEESDSEAARDRWRQALELYE